MTTDLKPFISPPFLSRLTAVSRILTQRRVKSYLVGGFVRDVLLGRDTADIDIAVAGNALQLAYDVAADFGGKYILLDEANQVGRMIMFDGNGRWQVDFSAMEGDIQRDMARRDFTINALAVDLGQFAADAAQVQVEDRFGGLADLDRRVIRAVGDTAFEDDALRLLRAVRLAAELGFSIESRTEALIRQNAPLIAEVAGERVREELLRLLAVPGHRWLCYLDEMGVLTSIIPELFQLKGVSQPREHFWNVFEHTLETVAAVDFLLRQGTWSHAGDKVLPVVPWSAVLAEHFGQEVSNGSTRRVMLKMAALLHDLAKPQTKSIEATGRMRFLGHAKDGAVMASGIMERLRFSNREIKLVEVMVEHHLRPGQMSNAGLPTSRAIYRYFRDTGDAGTDILFFSLADHLATRGPRLDLAAWREHAQMVEYVLEQYSEQQDVVAPPRLVDGHDLISIFDMSPGPKMGEFLEAVREAQAAGEVATREEALSYINQHLLSKGVNIHG